MPDSITIDGLKDVVDSLRNMGSRNAKRIVRKGLRAGARIAREAEREEAPKRTNKLRMAIRVTGAKAAPGTVAVMAGIRPKSFKDGAFYPYFVIHGHKVRGSSGRRVPPNDFESRAFERSAEASADAASRMILEELTGNF